MKDLLYSLLANELRKRIHENNLKPGDILPSENELAEENKISRVTVRKSLSLLEQEGYIYSAPGKGYFVREPIMDKYILNFNEINNNGKDFISKLLEVNVISPDPEISKILQVPLDRYVIILRRIILAEGKPIGYDLKYLPYDRGIPLVEREIRYATFPELMSKKSSLFSIKKDLKIYARAANEEISKLLNISFNSPLLVVEQKFYSAHNRVIGWGKTHYTSDYIELYAEWSFGQRLYENE